MNSRLIMIKDPNINYAPETCAHCNGSGGNICQVCKGQGSVLVAQPPRKCAHCGGSGGNICSACHGSGWAHSLIPP